MFFSFNLAVIAKCQYVGFKVQFTWKRRGKVSYIPLNEHEVVTSFFNFFFKKIVPLVFALLAGILIFFLDHWR